MTDMKGFYGLSREPFSKDVSYSELFQYSQVEMLLNRLKATIEDGTGLLVTGRAGTGKTTAVRAFLETLGARHRVIYLGQYQRGSALFARLGMEFGVRTHLLGAKRMVSLVQKVTDESSNGRRLVLVIDEAHLLERPTFEDIRLLTNADMDRRSPMSLIVIGQRWLRGMLRTESQEALSQRLRLRYSLEGLGEDETEQYIEHRLKLAGCSKKLFPKAVIKDIFVASDGIPREINNICYECLLEGASQRAPTVTEKIARWVINQRELS
jgi:general secretion pathway protein A